MHKVVGAALLAGGIALAVYGHNLGQGWAEQVTAAIEGVSSNQVWACYGAGAVLGAAGLALVLKGGGGGKKS